ncbi:hypothetical protein L3X38_002347 [Prunus dulcis]|uniref:Fumarylacetoacetase-like C-terminal domain-containing protein n=1 Tax=Prunus dulcis TaxID=3755 RepID=A0AAD4WTR2_PRUDU|nr:hypothetical protein L3X38_002347 [Prunus dulcis]
MASVQLNTIEAQIQQMHEDRHEHNRGMNTVECTAEHSKGANTLPKEMVPDPDNIELWLKVDGELRQKGSTKDMIFKLPFLISHISSIMTLLEGDVILTGTPKGVGPVKVGQKITAGITNLLDVEFNVEKRQKQGSS